jgi:hypothetical protein
MARAQFQGGTRAQGFNPVQVSNANIARMREESRRVVNNMTMRADAELKNRNNILQEMKENAEYYDKVRDRDYKIQSQNIRTEQQASRDRAAQAKEQANVNIRATEQIYGTIAKLSKTASEKLGEIEQEKYDEEWLSGVQDYMMNPNPAGLVEHKVGQQQLAIDNENFQSMIDEKEAAGADPLVATQARSMSPAFTAGRQYAERNSLLTTQFPVALEDALNDNERIYNVNGDTFTGVEARGNRARTAAVVATTQREFFVNNGLVGAKFEDIAPGLAAAQRSGQSVIAREGKVEEVTLKDNLSSNATNVLINGDFQANALTSFRTWMRTTGSAVKAHQQYESVATAINPTTGEFLVSEEDWRNAIVDDSGMPYAQKWGGRALKIERARMEARLDWQRSQNAQDNMAYKADSKRLLEGLTADPSEANAKAAVEFFRENYGKVPPEIEKFANSYTTEAIADSEFLEQARDLASRGMLTENFVEAAGNKGYEISNEVAKLYQGQKEKYGPEYDRAFKSLGQVAKDVVGVVPGKDTTASAAVLQTQAERDFQTRFQGYLAQGMVPADAANKAALEVQNEMKAGKTEEGNLYQRKVNPDGSISFPQIERRLAPSTAAQQRLKVVQDNLQRDKGLALSIPEAIINKAEGEKILQDFNAGRRINIPGTARYAATRLGINPLVVINNQLEANGQGSISSPALEAAGEVSPQFQELLFKTPSPQRSTRALGSTGNWNPAVLPSSAQQYVPMIEQAASANGLRAQDVAAMAEIESNWNPNAPSYNNSSFGLMQINRAAHPAFFQQNNWRDPQANLNYGAQYFAGLLKMYNGDYKAAAMAYNGGPGNYDAYVRGQLPDGPVKTEMVNHGRKYMQALYKYGGGQQALTSGQMQRPGFNFRQLVTGNPGIQSSADGARVYDPHGHGGADYHDHIELGSEGEVKSMVDLLSKTNDPWTGKPYRVTSTYRPGDKGAHGVGRAIDIAPPLNLPESEEQAWSEHLYKVIGLDPNTIK